MTVTILKRAQIPLAPANESHLSVRTNRIRGVIVHWIGGPSTHPSVTWASLQANAMNGHNVNHTEYGDIEYNAGFCESVAHPGNGTILEGRDPKWNGAHANSTGNLANTTCLGIALVGDKFTAAAKEALDTYIFLARLGADPAQEFVLMGHGELAAHDGGIATACPGPDILGWAALMRKTHGYVTL